MNPDPEILFENVFEHGLLKEILSGSEVVSAKEGKVILSIGSTIKFIPVVLAGLLTVLRTDEENRELLLYYINPGESCALTFTCCMQHYPSEIKITAEENSSLLMIDVKFMDEWLAKYPTWKSYVMKTIRNSFNEILKTIDMIAFQNLDSRLVSYLKNKSSATGSGLINLSHQQIADELATSRVVVSRLLKKLENERKLLLFRNQIKLLKEM
ncbi:MAG: Crp/Fnr family transcriptional regulator [Bacteroidetes bacterium]|nr:Crp/Fnr family transcriptional regulator [Bacteroidota bacterium]